MYFTCAGKEEFLNAGETGVAKLPIFELIHSMDTEDDKKYSKQSTSECSDKD